MIERQIPEPAGRFAKCPECERQPRHIECYGRSAREPTNVPIPNVRHVLECACGRHTARHEHFEDAEAEWGVAQSQIPLALPANVTRMRGRKPRKAVRS